MATMRNRMATVVILVFVAGVTAAALWAPGASAADFTIKVPVQLSNMDPSVKIQLVCDAYRAQRRRSFKRCWCLSTLPGATPGRSPANSTLQVVVLSRKT